MHFLKEPIVLIVIAFVVILISYFIIHALIRSAVREGIAAHSQHALSQLALTNRLLQMLLHKHGLSLDELNLLVTDSNAVGKLSESDYLLKREAELKKIQEYQAK